MDANPTSDDAPSPRPRITQLGDYELGPKLGTGAMGAVYRARQISKDRDVAVKVLQRRLSTNQVFLGRFMREAGVMSRLDHPNIVRCYGVGKKHGRYYLAMELVEGGTLGDWLVRLGKFTIGDALHVLLVCARALGHAHRLRLIHRDVKPDNVLLTREGQLKLADLGLAISMTDQVNLTSADTGAGTPVYVAPEQARNSRDADARSDLYALGCMFYQMLTGTLPFRGETSLEIVLAKLEGQYRPARELRPDLPRSVERVLNRLLAPHPDDRVQSAAELIAAVEGLGLANDRLSFLDTANAQCASTSTELALGQLTDLGEEDVEAEPGWWFVDWRTARGRNQSDRLTTAQVSERAADPIFLQTARVGRTPSETRPLTDWPEFRAITTGFPGGDALLAPPVRLTWWDRHQGRAIAVLLAVLAGLVGAVVVFLATRPPAPH